MHSGVASPVFAEKPMAGNVEGAITILRKVEGNGVSAMIDFNFRRIVNWHRTKTILDEGMIGDLGHTLSSIGMSKKQLGWR
jgi:predicted dehydrogenase